MSSSTSKRFLVYSLYSWLTPAVIVTVGISLDYLPFNPDGTANAWSPRYGDGLCWITSRMALLVLFAIPVMIIILINIGLFITSVRHIHKAAKAAPPANHSNNKALLFLYIKLSVVMGLTWVSGFIAAMYI